MENEDNFLAGLGLILIGIVFLMIILPLLLGIGIALIVGASGPLYYGIVITVSAMLWLIIGLTAWI